MTMQTEADKQVEFIQKRLHFVQRRIQDACQLCKRDPEELTLVAVSKFQPVSKIRAAYACGIRNFGENYAEEALRKQEEMADLAGLHWHMVGHIQSRKAKMLAGRFELIHSVDSIKLARLLARHSPDHNLPQDLLLQVNVAGEASKFGLPPELGALVDISRQILSLPGLRLRGLMGMPPLAENPDENRHWFARLRQLAAALNEEIGKPLFTQLSMGTSADFETAIMEGATHIRLGETIFGSRNSQEQGK